MENFCFGNTFQLQKNEVLFINVHNMHWGQQSSDKLRLHERLLYDKKNLLKMLLCQFKCFHFSIIKLTFVKNLEKRLRFFSPSKVLQSWPKYFKQTVVFLWNSTLREKFNFYFSRIFCYYWQNFNFGSKAEHQAIILWGFEIFLTFPNFLRSLVLSRSKF